jgi:16S rRNA G527 N7-methylase RsmG
MQEGEDMLSLTRDFLRLIVLASMLTGLVACQKTDTAANEKGPAEKAGQQLDQAASRAGEELNKAAEAAGKGLQQLGQKMQNEAEQAQQAQQQKKE